VGWVLCMAGPFIGNADAARKRHAPINNEKFPMHSIVEPSKRIPAKGMLDFYARACDAH
jgi:hypothetical protein